MAKYDYQCKECGEIKTLEFPMGTAPAFVGNHCNGKLTTMDRVITAANVSYTNKDFHGRKL